MRPTVADLVRRVRSAPSLVGSVHLLYGVALLRYTRDLPWTDFDPLYSVALVGPLYLMASCGLFLAGYLSVHLWNDRRYLSPGLILVGWVAWSVRGHWAMRSRFPLTSFTPVEWLDFQPYPDYLAKAAPLLALVAVGACCETVLRLSVRSVQKRWNGNR